MGLSLKKPSRERSEKRTKAAADKLGAGEKRIVADVPEHIHQQVWAQRLERRVIARDKSAPTAGEGPNPVSRDTRRPVPARPR
jgi:hypothetical protein